MQVATVLLLASNRERCVSALQQCPAAGTVMVRVASALQRLSVFSGVYRVPACRQAGACGHMHLRSHSFAMLRSMLLHVFTPIHSLAIFSLLACSHPWVVAGQRQRRSRQRRCSWPSAAAAVLHGGLCGTADRHRLPGRAAGEEVSRLWQGMIG